MEKAIQIILDDITRYKSTFLPWLLDEGRTKWKPTKEQCDAAGSSNYEEVKAYMLEDAPPHIIAWDTIANSPVKTQVEGEEFGGGMAYRARLIKSFIGRYQVAVEGCEKISLILINQVIDNIGDQWNPITTPCVS